MGGSSLVSELSATHEHLAREKSDWARRVEREFKVPVEGSLWPRVYWIACVVDDSKLFGSVRPTDGEVRMVASYIEYTLDGYYTSGYAARVRDLALPACAGHNTTIFAKRPDVAAEGCVPSCVGWGYKRMSWDSGSWPHSYSRSSARNLPDRPLTLVEVMDAVQGHGSYPHSPNPNWEKWKAEHPEVFLS